MPSPELPTATDIRLRVLIADDERLSREQIRRFLQSDPSIEVVAECASGIEAVRAISQEAPDVAFLDVRMPELDGFGVLKAFEGRRLPAIILVSAYDRFALRAFEIHAVDYLLKPFDRERFEVALRRARHRLQLDPPRTSDSSLPQVLTRLRTRAQPLERVAIRDGGRITFVKTADIDWVSAADNYAELHVGNKTYLLRTTIAALANRLPECFARISRSLLVNLEGIKEIRSKSHGDYFVVLHNGASLIGSRNFRRNLDELLR